MPTDVLTFLLGVAFAAGAMWARDARTRRDVNNLAAKQRRHENESRRRFIRTVRVLERLAGEPERAAVLELLDVDEASVPLSVVPPLNDQDEREHYRER
jgi:hypothetical protein